jgi:hypothetical protein
MPNCVLARKVTKEARKIKYLLIFVVKIDYKELVLRKM